MIAKIAVAGTLLSSARKPLPDIVLALQVNLLDGGWRPSWK